MGGEGDGRGGEGRGGGRGREVKMSKPSLFLTERTLGITALNTLDGTPVSIRKSMHLEKAQVLPRGSLREDNVEWDGEEIEEATGNEGASMDRW
jgi:hypothetical protein